MYKSLFQVDLLFLVLGFCYLFQKNKKYWLGFLGLILVAPIPAALAAGEGSYVGHGSLIYPVFILLIGLGISFFISLFKKRNLRIVVIVILGLAYGFLILNFMYIYFLRFPLYNSEGVNFSSRILASYIKRLDIQRKVYVFTSEPSGYYKAYLFYTNAYNKDNASKIGTGFKNGDFVLGNVVFRQYCPSISELNKDDATIIMYNACTKMKPKNKDKQVSAVSISQLKDSGTVLKIYNDTVCQKYKLNNYPANITFSDFDVEKLSNKEFCTKFISHY